MAFCDRCSGIILNDAADHFNEGETRSGMPTLRHLKEGADFTPLEISRIWIDSLPGLPRMRVSSETGCQLCEFIRNAILQRKLQSTGTITINGGYVWRGPKKSYQEAWDDGLFLFRCEIYSDSGKLGDINFGIESDDEILLQWLRVDDKRAPTALDPDNVEWLKSEIWRCENECEHKKPDATFLPTRLIDVGETELDNPRLVLSDEVPAEKKKEDGGIDYAALSYCWGTKEVAARQLQTTQSTFQERCSSIEFTSLTPVVRDAVLVCRALEIRYLWIDALCIIQDDIDDWDRESALMGVLYYSAQLTICPISSASCVEGFLEPRPKGLDIPFKSNRRVNVAGTYTLYRLWDDTEQTSPYPFLSRTGTFSIDEARSSWATRGWTFQEQFMSSRLLLFGPQMWHFACEGGLISETAYQTDGPVMHGPIRDIINAASSPPDDSKSTSENVANATYPYQCWENIREIQSRKWTYKTDIFPGIAGLAAQCANVTGDVYLAGLWKQDLIHGLLWEATVPEIGTLDSILEKKRYPNPYIAPSWSWASQSGRFEPFSDRWRNTKRPKDLTGDTGMYFVDTQKVSTHNKSGFQLVGYHMSLYGSSPFGRLQEGSHLVLRGKLASLPSDITMIPRQSGLQAQGFFQHDTGVCCLDWSFDVEEIQKSDHLLLFLVATSCKLTTNWDRLSWRKSIKNGGTVEDNPILPDLDHCWKQGPYAEIDHCPYCLDEDSPKAEWGLVVHQAKSPGEYYRLGVFAILPVGEQKAYFKGVMDVDISLV